MGNALSSVSSRATATALGSERELQQNGFIQLSRTHDVSLTEEHIPQVERFVADLQEAIDAIRLGSNEGRYKEAHVLFLSWEEDNIGVKQEINDLRSVFSRFYRYQTHEYEINSQKPGRDTQSKVASFLSENDSHDNLLILYYAGHGIPSRQGSEAPIWAATDKPGTPTLAAGAIQALFEEADSDVLLLYDCCHSAHPAVTISGHGVTEVIAASGFDLQAPGAGMNSFTHALVQALTQACRGPPFSVAKLHEMVLRSLKSRIREHLRDERGEIWTDPSGRPALQRHPSSTPVHCFLTEERPHRGIVLSPLPPLPLDSTGSSQSAGTPTTSSNSQSTGSDSQTSLATDVSDQDRNESTNVLLSIQLEKAYFKDEMDENLRIWREWIRNMPPEAKGVKIDAIYDSFSTLVLLSLPIALWDLLPDNSAYSFVGFVTSDNNVSIIQELETAQGEEGNALSGEAPPDRTKPKRKSNTPKIIWGSHGMLVFENNTATLVVISKHSEIEFIETTSTDIFKQAHRDGRTVRQMAPIPEEDSGYDTASKPERGLTKRQLAEFVPYQLAENIAWPAPNLHSSRPKQGWTAGDLAERAKGARHLLRMVPDSPARLRTAKLTLLYNIKIISPSLKILRDLEYQIPRDVYLGGDYQDALIRCATLIEWHLVLAQVVLIQTPHRATPLLWASLTQSMLLDEELSLRGEQEEAEELKVVLERFVTFPSFMVEELRGE